MVSQDKNPSLANPTLFPAFHCPMLAKIGVRELQRAHQGNWDGKTALSLQTQHLWRIPQIPNQSLKVGSQCPVEWKLHEHLSALIRAEALVP